MPIETTNLLANLGDASMDHGNPEYGGYLIFGPDPSDPNSRPHAEYVMPFDNEQPESDGTCEQSYMVYRFDLDQCTYDPFTDTLSDNPYWPQASAWFAPNTEERQARPQDSNLAVVARSSDIMEGHLVSWLTGTDLLARARAYEAIADYHGWDNFDSYPLTLTQAEADARYSNVHIHRSGQTGYMADACQAISTDKAC